MMRRLLSVCIALCAFSLPTAGPASAQEVRPDARVVRNVVVRVAPDTSSEAVGALRPGDSAELQEDLPRWYRVLLRNGVSGYVTKAWTRSDRDKSLLAASGVYKVHVIDVGTGLAVFAEGPDFTLLYDAGTQDDLADGEDNRVLAYIRAVRPGLQKLDHVILSHPHKDHLELMPDIFDAFAVRNVWDSGRVNKTQGYCRFLKKVVAEPGLQYHDAIASNATRTVNFTGSRCSGAVTLRQAERMPATPVRLGANAAMSFLYRDATAHSDPNENTVVVRLDLGGGRVLLAGDAEAGARQTPSVPPQPQSIEGQLLACCAAALKAEVLVVGHHGSLTSSRKAFLNAVGASIFVISSSRMRATSLLAASKANDPMSCAIGKFCRGTPRAGPTAKLHEPLSCPGMFAGTVKPSQMPALRVRSVMSRCAAVTVIICGTWSQPNPTFVR